MLHFLLLSSLVGYSWSKTVTYDWHIRWRLAAPDDFARPIISINEMWPPPTIEANVGDTIIVDVYNELGNETTSIHFHGMHQNGTAATDGPVGVTQCGIAPGRSLQYRFVANPAGTHWWHSHGKAQYTDGLRGKMIIHDPVWEASLNVNSQIFLSVSDWWHQQAPFMVHDYLSPNNTNGFLPTPDSFLLNDGRAPPRFTLKRGERYLVRIVSFAGLVCGQFHIADHTLTVVAIDGVPVHPAVTDTIGICAGQSYDFIVVGNQYERAANYILKMTTDMLTGTIPSNQMRALIGSISLEDNASFSSKNRPHDYEGVSHVRSHLRSNWTAQGMLDDAILLPLDNEPLFKNVTHRINFRTNQVYYEGIGTRIGIGMQPYTEPRLPTLQSALTTGKLALDWTTYGPGVSPYVVRHNAVVEIYMENPQVWPHPMHLHGHSFQIAGRGLGSWDGDENSLYKTPARRNNIVIPPSGWFLIRFRADNPGVWFFHCHIDLHLVGGMGATIIEAPDVLQRQQRFPVQNLKACNADYRCSVGTCNCRLEKLSEEESNEQCNTIFNFVNPARYGALIQ
ncbi:multicopper oxidase [Karstenula rhodostoma CBS 690.94]|uniref:Multicopper oxidase n=1 Tax=Karstenula rhodostoma CBS 690.94 TaxID=1392251 RepID=A0A9P4U4P7_9PLEO|nr:multicopper oxidase [Karstenula rhodostoma CBS 690.94]